jgi:hypothetical protein
MKTISKHIIGRSRSARFCNSEARVRARHEPKFSVRDRLAKEELLIELELGLSKKILVQTSRSRTLESTNKSNTKSKKAKDRKIECKLVGIEAKSAILNPESWQINGFEASPFLKLWIVVAEIHESY